MWHYKLNLQISNKEKYNKIKILNIGKEIIRVKPECARCSNPNCVAERNLVAAHWEHSGGHLGHFLRLYATWNQSNNKEKPILILDTKKSS